VQQQQQQQQQQKGKEKNKNETRQKALKKEEHKLNNKRTARFSLERGKRKT